MNEMEKAIRDFGKQFDYVPEIKNKGNLKPFRRVVLCGMGGSHLAAGIFNTVDSEFELYTHSDYGLPKRSFEFFQDSLIIASSYSGNTEETISALEETLQKNLNVVVLTTGGKLLEIAREKNLPFIEMPNTGIQPRSALGFSFVALAYLLDDKKIIKEIENIKGKLNPENFEQKGKELTEKISGKTPIIYTSTKNLSIAYNWKIKFNETGKIPAFYNVFPEMNHNELTGFDLNNKTKAFASKFVPIFIFDSKDNPKIARRMQVAKKIYQDKGLECLELALEGQSDLQKVFSALLIADWAAFYTALANGAEPNEVKMVEGFKKEIS